MGRGRGARLGVDAAPARRRVPAHPAARRGRGAAARPTRVPAGRGALLRAEGAARLGWTPRDHRPASRHRRRRLQPPRGDRSRGRAEPAPSGPRRLPLRRDAARVAAGGDRPLHRRHRRGLRGDRRARTRRQPAVRDAPLRRDDEVRREGTARPGAVGDRADRRQGRALRLPRARPRRRAHRLAVGRSGSGARAQRARPARPDRERPPRLPRRRQRPPAPAALRPQRRRVSTSSSRRCTRGATRRCATGASTAGSRWSRSSRCSRGSTPCATRSTTRAAG